MKKLQWICVLFMAIGCVGMGAHLYLDDGIANPTHVLTIFAVIFAVGMYGNMIAALLLLAVEIRKRRKSK